MGFKKATINANLCKLSDLYIPLSCFVETDTFLLKAVETKYVYNEDKKADKVIEGYRYTVVDMESFSTFDILVTMKTPIVTQDQIDARNRDFLRVAVSLDETFVHLYDYDRGTLKAKVTTTYIELVE